MSLKNKIAIVGADETDNIGIVPDVTPIMMHAEAARNALRDAGIDKSQVDAVFTADPSPMSATQLCEYMGIRPRYIDNTMTGGSSFVIHVEHAAAAMAAGLCGVALITHGETGFSGRRRRGPRGGGGFDSSLPAAQFEVPFGVGGAPSAYCMAAMRHMHQYGTTSEHLAEIAVATRKWAQLNPKAMMRDDLTIDDVLSSRWIAYPFHIYDCCLVTDAGGAIVLASAERARDFRRKPVWVLGSGEATTHQTLLGMEDITRTPARHSGKRAFEMAGVTRGDIDVVEVYDSFTYTALVTLEELGFCEKGEGGPFVSGQRTAPGGDFPMNTNGGGLSYTHPGMYGMFILIEAVRQLRGECSARQVKDCEVAIAHGNGGVLSTQATVILGAPATV
jgi:acetyl-CoA acetyltransferase